MIKPPRPPSALPPQPWSVPTGGTRPEIHDNNGRVICRMADTGDAMEAVATVMSLAPEMLAALKDMVTCFGGHSDALARQHLAQAKAIIAKAHGQ